MHHLVAILIFFSIAMFIEVSPRPKVGRGSLVTPRPKVGRGSLVTPRPKVGRGSLVTPRPKAGYSTADNFCLNVECSSLT
jgi:hypothetical protein